MHRVPSVRFRLVAVLSLTLFGVVWFAPAAAQTPPSGSPGGPREGFAVGGAVDGGRTLTLAEVQPLPLYEVTAETRTRAGSQGKATYRGALLRDVLALAKPRNNAAVKNDLLSRSITATGSDGYRVTFAWGEIDAEFAAQPIMVVYEKDGQPLGADGTFEIVVPNDNLAGRWVKNLVRLTINETPA